MNTDTKILGIPALVSDILTEEGTQTDNLVAGLWKKLKLSSLIKKSGFKKRTGLPIEQVVYLLLIWV